MECRTHQKIDPSLCGTPVLIEESRSRVELNTTKQMAADGTGLVHGGFIFGLADYSAMIAVNHPNVVLGAADVKFIKPVKVGQLLVSEAATECVDDKKHTVLVSVSCATKIVFSGKFICFVLDKHVLD